MPNRSTWERPVASMTAAMSATQSSTVGSRSWEKVSLRPVVRWSKSTTRRNSARRDTRRAAPANSTIASIGVNMPGQPTRTSGPSPMEYQAMASPSTST